MKINSEQFLKQPKDKPLAPCYWLTGEEPLQLQECRDVLLTRAAACGFTERQNIDVSGNDSAALQAELYTKSIFSKQRIIEIHLTQGKCTETVSTLLLAFCQKPNPDVLLVIHSPKLESGVTQSRPYKAFDAIGVIIQSWPITEDQLPQWFSARLARHQLSTSLQGLNLLSERTEGNLLYAAQSVEKLAMLYPEKKEPLSIEEIMHVVASQAHFDVFQLSEAFLLGEKMRSLTIARNLHDSGVEIILVFAALLREIHLLIKLSTGATGQNFSDQCQKLGIWDQRRPRYRAALQRIKNYLPVLKNIAYIDQLIKGVVSGDPWLALERFLIKFT